MSENQGFGINELEVGQSAEIERQVDDELIAKFAEVSGDFNPLHMDEEFAAKTPFRGRIAHGALVASSFTKPFAQRMHALSTGVKPDGHARSPVTEKEYLRGANRVR